MKTLLTVSAAGEFAAGLAFLKLPVRTVTLLLGTPIDGDPALVVARMAGATLMTLGVACWMAREDSRSAAAHGLVGAMMLYNTLAAVILAFAGIGDGMHGMVLWPAVVFHAAMSVWCLVGLQSRIS